jgi:TonB family protein
VEHAVSASIAAINRYLVVPRAAPDGRVFVQIEVDKEGRVRHPRIAKGLRADLDSAVMAATRQLPAFIPGKQYGHAVAVSIMAPITVPVKSSYKLLYGA